MAFALNLTAAVLLSFYWQIGEPVALTTTANSALLFFTRESNISAVALIHPPFATVAQLIFIPLLRQVGLTFFSGPLLTSLIGAFSIVFLNLILLEQGMPLKYRWVFLLLTAAYPSLLYTSATGTREALFIFVLIFVLWGSLQVERNNMAFLICGFGLALGFFADFRAVPLTIGLTLALIVYEWRSGYEWRSELEGRLIAYITPILYTMGLWLIFNISQFDDAFFFLKQNATHAFSPATASNATVFHPLFLGWGNIFEAIRITLRSLWQNAPIFLITAGAALFPFFYKNRRAMFSILLILFSAPIFMAVQIFTGSLPPWHYIWAYGIPMGIVLAGMFFQNAAPKRRSLVVIVTVLLIIASAGINLSNLRAPTASIGEQRLHALMTGQPDLERDLRDIDTYWILRHDGPLVAAALDDLSAEGKILIDTSAAPLTLWMTQPEQLLAVDEIDFNALFEFPGFTADYVLVLEESDPLYDHYGSRDYPALEEANVNYASLAWSSDQTLLNWRLYTLDIE
ncbi:hypothetical protein KQH56_00050 [bacterium]|nr:hypothetical protein [bacterium]